MTAVIQGQQTVNQFPSFALPGQLADIAYNEIASFPAYEVIQPGRMLEMASDGISVQQVQNNSAASTTPSSVGIAILITSREQSGSIGITSYGIGGPQYNIGDMVPVLQRGRIYAEWSGTTQTAYAMPNVYKSSTVVTNRGKMTDAGTSAGAGTEVANAGHQYRVRGAQSGSGNIVLVDVNLPGAA
jgi:hypothetical protein